MKRTGRTLSLKGTVKMASVYHPVHDDFFQIWSDERHDFVWKVTNVSIGPLAPNRVFNFNSCEFWTIPDEQTDNADAFEMGMSDNRCIGQFVIAVRGGLQTAIGSGVMHAILDPEAFITRELGIRSTNDAEFSYLFTLEEYQTTPVEEVIQVLKTSGQKVGVIDDGSGEV